MDKTNGHNYLPIPNSHEFGGVTDPRKRAFLLAYCLLGTVTHAAEAAGICVKTHRNWKAADGDYAEAFKDARNGAADRLEGEAIHRATNGVGKPVLYQGQIVMVPSNLADPDSPKAPLIEYERSDTLLIFLLKAIRPEKFRDNARVTVDGKLTHPIELKSPIDGVQFAEQFKNLIASGAAPGGE